MFLASWESAPGVIYTWKWQVLLARFRRGPPSQGGSPRPLPASLSFSYVCDQGGAVYIASYEAGIQPL